MAALSRTNVFRPECGLNFFGWNALHLLYLRYILDDFRGEDLVIHPDTEGRYV